MVGTVAGRFWYTAAPAPLCQPLWSVLMSFWAVARHTGECYDLSFGLCGLGSVEIGNWVWNQVWRVVSVSREGYRCKSRVQLRVTVKLKLELELELGGLDGLLLISRGRRTRGHHTEAAREERVMNRLLSTSGQ